MEKFKDLDMVLREKCLASAGSAVQEGKDLSLFSFAIRALHDIVEFLTSLVLLVGFRFLLYCFMANYLVSECRSYHRSSGVVVLRFSLVK